MNKALSRVLWAIAGVLLIIAGIICLFRPAAAVGGMTAFLGVAMLFSGIVDIVIFAVGNNALYGAGWFLVDGILTVLLSLFILFNQAFTALTLPFIFGMWLLFSGVVKFVNSFELKRLGVSGWGWFTALGILTAVLGFISFMEPVVSLIALSVIVGVVLIMQGIASIMRAIFTNRFII